MSIAKWNIVDFGTKTRTCFVHGHLLMEDCLVSNDDNIKWPFPLIEIFISYIIFHYYQVLFQLYIMSIIILYIMTYCISFLLPYTFFLPIYISCYNHIYFRFNLIIPTQKSEPANNQGRLFLLTLCIYYLINYLLYNPYMCRILKL